MRPFRESDSQFVTYFCKHILILIYQRLELGKRLISEFFNLCAKVRFGTNSSCKKLSQGALFRFFPFFLSIFYSGHINPMNKIV